MIKTKKPFNVEFLEKIKRNIKLTKNKECSSKCKYLYHTKCDLFDLRADKRLDQCKSLFFDLCFKHNMEAITLILEQVVPYNNITCDIYCEFLNEDDQKCELFHEKLYLGDNLRCTSCLKMEQKSFV